jgi:hypothetical protein
MRFVPHCCGIPIAYPGTAGDCTTRCSAAGERQFDTNLAGDASQGHTYRPLTAYEDFLYAQHGLAPIASASTNTSQIALGATKELRNGIVLTPSITVTRLTDNLTNRGGINQGAIEFAVTLPLCADAGRLW